MADFYKTHQGSTVQTGRMYIRTFVVILSSMATLLGQNMPDGQTSLQFKGPLLAVEDVARSKAFYVQLLDQKVRMDFGRDVNFEGEFTIHQKSHFQELLGGAERYPVVTKAHDGELYFESAQPEVYVKRLEQAGVTFVHGLREQPWGQRVVRFYDPDGHVIEIGEPMEAAVRRLHGQRASVEDIVKKTHLPKAAVEQYLR